MIPYRGVFFNYFFSLRRVPGNSSAMRRFRRILRRLSPGKTARVTRCVSGSVRAPISRQSRKLAYGSDSALCGGS